LIGVGLSCGQANRGVSPHSDSSTHAVGVKRTNRLLQLCDAILS
jgi:hypothetical protein